MARTSKSKVDRRRFLKGAGAAGAAALAVPAAIGGAAAAPPEAPAATPLSPEQASQRLAAETAPLGEEANPLIVTDPGSDFMVDVLKTLDFEYIISNPGSSFRGLHESFINHGGNKSPEWLTCTHEQAAVNIANGYYAVAGKPMAMITFAPSGLQHAMMGIFGAFSGRTPTYLLCANILDGEARRPAFDWGPHAMQDPADMVRDMLKWDDTPGSLQHFAESAVRAYKLAMTEPRGPVMLVVDASLQENAIADRSKLRIPTADALDAACGRCRGDRRGGTAARGRGKPSHPRRQRRPRRGRHAAAGGVGRDAPGPGAGRGARDAQSAPVERRRKRAHSGRDPRLERGRALRPSQPLSGSAGARVHPAGQADGEGHQHHVLRPEHARQLPERRALPGGQSRDRGRSAGDAAGPHRGVQAAHHTGPAARHRRARQGAGRRVGASARARAGGGELRLGRQPDYAAAPVGRSVGRGPGQGLGLGRRRRSIACGTWTSSIARWAP